MATSILRLRCEPDRRREVAHVRRSTGERVAEILEEGARSGLGSERLVEEKKIRLEPDNWSGQYGAG